MAIRELRIDTLRGLSRIVHNFIWAVDSVQLVYKEPCGGFRSTLKLTNTNNSIGMDVAHDQIVVWFAVAFVAEAALNIMSAEQLIQ